MQNLDETKRELKSIEARVVDVEKLQRVKEIQQKTDGKFERIQLSEEKVDNKELLSISAGNMGVDFIDLKYTFVNKNALKKVSLEVVKKFFVFPFDIKNNHLYLAMQNPDDIFVIDEIKFFIQMEIKPFLADSRLIGKAIKYFYRDDNKIDINSIGKINISESEKEQRNNQNEEVRIEKVLQEQILNRFDASQVKSVIDNSESNFRRNLVKLLKKEKISGQDLNILQIEKEMLVRGIKI